MALAPSASAERPAVDLTAGQTAYQHYCARCHGNAGKGDGLDAKRHYPRPRDFTAGVYKFRSTATGTSPTDDDLFRTITDGLPGSGMPDWRHLSEATRWQLVYYLKTLSDAFETTPPEPVALGSDPGRRRADLAKGRKVYETLGCAACHGPNGLANGTSAPTLVDQWDAKLRPADLTYGWSYRGGSEPQAVVTRMIAGIDGTPMPSYAEAVTAEEAWHLAYYVRSLQRPPAWGAILRVVQAPGRLPESPEDRAWDHARATDLRLRPVVGPAGEISAPLTVPVVSLKVLANRESISFRLSWHDPSEDRGDSPDALVLALRPEGVDGDVVTLQTWPAAGGLALDLCAWTPNHLQNREAVSRRYEPVLTGSTSLLPLGGQAVYHDGEWSVVLTRPLARQESEQTARLEPGRLAPLAVAVWDGGNPGHYAVSTWIDLLLGQAEEPREAGGRGPQRYLAWLAAAVMLLGIGLAVRKR